MDGFQLTEQNYRALFQNASDAMLVHDMDGRTVEANRASEKLFGFPRAELIGKDVREFLVGEFLERAREIRRKLLAGEEFNQPYGQSVLRKDGSLRRIEMSTSLVIIGGKPVGFQHVARDVTEEKTTAELLAKITDGSPIATFVIDRLHLITHWNTALEAMTGWKAADMRGTDQQWRAFYADKRPTMADLIVDGASAQEIEAFYRGKYRRSGLIEGAYEAEDFFRSLSPSGMWLHFTASPIRSENGEIVAAIETLQDRTDERQLQESMHYYVQLITRAQEEERKALARDLHDDLSQALLLLIRRFDLVPPAGRSKQAAALRASVEELRGQAVKALDYVRHYVQNLRPRILDDLGLVAALNWMAEDAGRNYGIKTQVKVLGTDRPLAGEVQLLLFRIAQEALTNVGRHAHASQATIQLEYADESVSLTVSDNGRGFAVPARLEELASAGRLGIMGMAERARLLQGTLEVKSAAGEGTSVIVRLPLVEEIRWPAETGAKRK